jgi:hypothetical protein
MLILLLALVGIAGLISGGMAVRFLRRTTGDDATGRGLAGTRKRMRAFGVIIGVATLVLSNAIGYSYTGAHEVGRIVGLPFMAAYFDAHGRDYVGPLTLPAVLANSVFWGLCPQIILAGYILMRQRNASRREGNT